MKKIAIITAGRDCPGLNALIRALVRIAINHYRFEVFGVKYGFEGLINGNFLKLDNFSVSDISHRGGTLLKTSSKFFKFDKQLIKKIKKILKKFQIDGLIVSGGEGTAFVSFKLSMEGIPLVFIPTTIDNNICGCESLGFDSVLTNLVGIVDKIKDTAASSPAVFIIELGQDKAGFQTLFLGLLSGVEWLDLPGRPINLNKLVEGIKKGIKEGKTHQLILTSFSGRGAEKISGFLRKKIQLPVKNVYLENIENGGSPTGRDLVLASLLAEKALSLLARKSDKNAVGFCENQIKAMLLSEVVKEKKKLPENILELHQIVSF